jgi:hypothetical protein
MLDTQIQDKIKNKEVLQLNLPESLCIINMILAKMEKKNNILLI